MFQNKIDWLGWLFLLFSCFFYCNISLAQPAQLNGENQKFDLGQANQSFDQLNIKLTNQNLNLSNLKATVSELTQLQNQAKECVNRAQSGLTSVEEKLKSNSFKNADVKKGRADYQYLTNRRDRFSNRLAECQLFVFRSQEALAALQKTIQNLSTSGLLERGTPIWQVASFKSLRVLAHFNRVKMKQLIGWEQLSLASLIALFALLLVAVAAGLFIRYLCQQSLKKAKELTRFKTAILRSLKMFTIPLFVFGVLSSFCAVIYWGSEPEPTIELASYAVFIYTATLAFAWLLFTPGEQKRNSLHLSADLAQGFFVRTVVGATLIMLGYLVAVFFREQEIGEQAYEMLQLILVTGLSFVVVWFCWLFSKLPLLVNLFGGFLSLLVRFLLIILLLGLVVTEWLGYHNLVLYLVKGLLLTTVVLAILWLLIRVVDSLLFAVETSQGHLSQNIRNYLGIKTPGSLVETIFTRVALYLAFVLVVMVFLTEIWGMSLIHVKALKDALVNGFKIANTTIEPLRIIIALLMFSVIHAVGRLIATHVARKHQFSGEKDTQVAVASIISYIGFGVALLVMLLVAGVNFTGLAIIAGALSVGIGLGLQNIANNFISGIILLLEKPIKPGDRIVVGQTEGFVKKVRIRSTQISTLAKEDVIVPNADLISTQVKNYMFRDSLYRVKCRVGVAYGSDTDKVREVMLEVAQKNTDVIQDSGNGPLVFFIEFGDSALIFELWCVIRNVNDRFMVVSNLHFAIDEAFRENNIIIAFPQRDLHVKNYVKS